MYYLYWDNHDRCAQTKSSGGVISSVTDSVLAGVPFIRIEGECDHAFAPRLRHHIFEHISSGKTHLLFDLRSCIYIDGGGLGALLRTLAEVEAGGWIAVVGPDPNVHRLLEIVGLLGRDGFYVFADELAAEDFIRADR